MGEGLGGEGAAVHLPVARAWHAGVALVKHQPLVGTVEVEVGGQAFCLQLVCTEGVDVGVHGGGLGEGDVGAKEAGGGWGGGHLRGGASLPLPQRVRVTCGKIIPCPGVCEVGQGRGHLGVIGRGPGRRAGPGAGPTRRTMLAGMELLCALAVLPLEVLQGGDRAEEAQLLAAGLGVRVAAPLKSLLP